MYAATRILLLLGGLALAACGDSQQAGNEPAAAGAKADIETLPPDESIATPSEDLVDGAIDKPLAKTSASAAGRLPPALYGRWGLTPADCASDQPNRGVMTIAANGVRFFNSLAKPTGTATSGPNGVRGEFAFFGEAGRTWTGPLSLTVQDNKLTRIDSEADSRQVYTRCM
ncbi:hypothetical protein [Sphingomonas sp.]|uniref:hypothetical protein n=1 Tax=Sphingomonas sp. TaxID=28214 RepID=UPI0018333A5E|nr:hypothetical protein [Sphingomonas sp.]MBA3512714.1 hypothetical protein [Sphingomonas sp.]